MSNIQPEQLDKLATLRAVVGLLGEQAQSSYWSSSFFDAGSKSFLAPVFPRTQILAQYRGVTSAAAIVHDDRIGVGDVFHLFRLPEDMEQGLHAAAEGTAVPSITESTASRESALQFLTDYTGENREKSEGPVKIGPLISIRDASVWKEAAAYYLAGIEANTDTFPFFSDK
jgi:hypothetical protein